MSDDALFQRVADLEAENRALHNRLTVKDDYIQYLEARFYVRKPKRTAQPQ